MSEIVKVIKNVDTIESLYDERAEAVTMQINRKCFCIKHEFINASLRWEKQILDTRDHEKESGRLYSVSLESPERPNFNYEWGTGYGGIRFCKRCKFIDCIHCFKGEIEYHIIQDDFYYSAHVVARCEICERKILRQGWGQYDSDPKAWDIINRVAKELNAPPFGDPRMGQYGSNFYTIFPAEASRRLKVSEEACERYVRHILRSGECRG